MGKVTNVGAQSRTEWSESGLNWKVLEEERKSRNGSLEVFSLFSARRK